MELRQDACANFMDATLFSFDIVPCRARTRRSDRFGTCTPMGRFRSPLRSLSSTAAGTESATPRRFDETQHPGRQFVWHERCATRGCGELLLPSWARWLIM